MIPFEEIRTAATGDLQRDLIHETWQQLGLKYGLDDCREMPVIPGYDWSLRSDIQLMIPKLPMQKSINLSLGKIANFIASQERYTPRQVINSSAVSVIPSPAVAASAAATPPLAVTPVVTPNTPSMPVEKTQGIQQATNPSPVRVSYKAPGRKRAETASSQYVDGIRHQVEDKLNRRVLNRELCRAWSISKDDLEGFQSERFSSRKQDAIRARIDALAIGELIGRLK
jgi:hypothetical protein